MSTQSIRRPRSAATGQPPGLETKDIKPPVAAIPPGATAALGEEDRVPVVVAHWCEVAGISFRPGDETLLPQDVAESLAAAGYVRRVN